MALHSESSKPKKSFLKHLRVSSPGLKSAGFAALLILQITALYVYYIRQWVLARYYDKLLDFNSVTCYSDYCGHWMLIANNLLICVITVQYLIKLATIAVDNILRIMGNYLTRHQLARTNPDLSASNFSIKYYFTHNNQVKMSLLQLFFKYYSKEYYDFDRNDINIHNFHPQLRIFLSMNGIFFSYRNSLLRFCWPVFNVSLTIVGLSFEFLFIYHGLDTKDYSFASESFCYAMILGTVPFVYVSILGRKNKIMQLIDDMNSDFLYISTLGSEYKYRFFKGQLLIWKLCYLWMGFGLSTVCLFIMNMGVMLVYQSLFATQDEHMIRPLVFPMWLPEDDPYRSPNYEIFLIIDITLSFVVIQTFAACVYMQFHFLLHYFYLMDMIMLDLGLIFEGVEESAAQLPREHPRRVAAQMLLNARLARIVKWHNAVFKSVKYVSSIFGPILIYQVILSSFAICIIAYQIADYLDQGKFHYLFVMLLIGGCVQLWIPCYLGTLIRNKAFAVGEACWNCGWHETSLGRMLRTDFVIIILRSQRPVIIQYTGLAIFQLETFSSIMSSAYSYFNMLRQST